MKKSLFVVFLLVTFVGAAHAVNFSPSDLAAVGYVNSKLATKANNLGSGDAGKLATVNADGQYERSAVAVADVVQRPADSASGAVVTGVGTDGKLIKGEVLIPNAAENPTAHMPIWVE